MLQQTSYLLHFFVKKEADCRHENSDVCVNQGCSAKVFLVARHSVKRETGATHDTLNEKFFSRGNGNAGP